MRLPGRLRNLRLRPLWLAAALLAGLLLHFAAVFGVTYALPRPGMEALSAVSAVNTMTMLPPVTPAHQPLPFMMTDTLYAVCRYDIRKGPVVLHASLGDDDWTIALFAPSGDNVYVVSGADLDRREIELLLTATQDGLASPLSTAKDAAATSVTVGLGNRTGIAVISAPMTGPAFASVTERLLLQASCQQRGKVGAAN